MRETSSLLLSEAREDAERLLSSTDPKREPRAFQLALTRKMGTKRDREEGSFVRETRRQAIDFYRDLVQDLKPWQGWSRADLALEERGRPRLGADDPAGAAPP